MGVDFFFSGSASYPRYYEEVEKIAVQCFGATLSNKFIKDEKKVEKSVLNPEYMFGSVHDRHDKFIFPKETPKIIVEFCREPVGKSYNSTELWEIFQQHPEIENISHQIWDEVKYSAEDGYPYEVD